MGYNFCITDNSRVLVKCENNNPKNVIKQLARRFNTVNRITY